MSNLPQGVEVKYDSVRVKITQCTSDAPMCWYRKYIGEVFTVNLKTWYENGEVTHVNYEMPKTPTGGFNGHIHTEDIELL